VSAKKSEVMELPAEVVYHNRAEVVSVKDTKTHIGIMFKSPRTEGGISVEKKDGWHKVHRCTDPAKLVRLIKKNPLKDIPYSTQ